MEKTYIFQYKVYSTLRISTHQAWGYLLCTIYENVVFEKWNFTTNDEAYLNPFIASDEAYQNHFITSDEAKPSHELWNDFDMPSHELWKDLDLPSHEFWNFISQKQHFHKFHIKNFTTCCIWKNSLKTPAKLDKILPKTTSHNFQSFSYGFLIF